MRYKVQGIRFTALNLVPLALHLGLGGPLEGCMVSRTEQIVPLISEEEIRAKVEELARILSEEYAGRDVVMVGVLKGAYIFMADLVRRLSIPVSCDFVRASSYGSGTTSSGAVRLTFGPVLPVRAKDVILVEDIIDTGRTARHIVDALLAEKPASLKICTLLNKPARREVALDVAYIGFSIPNVFVVGYGLDYDERFRHLPYIGMLKT